MQNKLMVAVATGLIVASVGEARAGCRKDTPISKVVYSQTVTNAAQQETATVTYTVEGVQNECESGDASDLNPLHGWHPLDTRACDYFVVQRYIERNIIVQKANLPARSIGSTRSAYPDIRHSNNDNCNTTITQGSIESIKSEALGTQETWQDYINKDADSVHDILVLIGAVSA